MAEARTASGALTSQYFSLGCQTGSSASFYTIDQLGSIREVTSSTGAIEAQLAYDAQGRQQIIAGSFAADFRYAGYYYHSRSSLSVTANRLYSPQIARWLNRDPAEEGGGINLYSYVSNNPVSNSDQSGLAPWCNCTTTICCDQQTDKCLAASNYTDACCYQMNATCHTQVGKGGTFSNNNWPRCRQDRWKRSQTSRTPVPGTWPPPMPPITLPPVYYIPVPIGTPITPILVPPVLGGPIIIIPIPIIPLPIPI